MKKYNATQTLYRKGKKHIFEDGFVFSHNDDDDKENSQPLIKRPHLPNIKTLTLFQSPVKTLKPFQV